MMLKRVLECLSPLAEAIINTKCRCSAKQILVSNLHSGQEPPVLIFIKEDYHYSETYILTSGDWLFCRLIFCSIVSYQTAKVPVPN